MQPGLNPINTAWKFLSGGGWVFVLIFTLWIGLKGWVYWRQNLWASKQKFVLLAIDIPEEHLQSPMAAENVFATLWGTYSSTNYLDHYWRGKFQLAHSVEIVSIEGYVQFLIHTPESWRDTVESAFYAQFPNCEITEVEDYAQYGPKEFPSETHQMWGTEMMESKSHFYPIRTYRSFEDPIATEQTMTDPVAVLLEVLAKIGPGEQIWIQWVITPLIDSWQKGSKELIDKLAGKKIPPKISLIQRLFNPIIKMFVEFGNTIAVGFGKDGFFGSSESSSSDDPPSMMLYLTPGENMVIKAIQDKVSKAGFATKMRFIYLAEKERYSVPRGVQGVMGYLKQYADLNLNSVRPFSKTMTSADYFFKEYRLNRIRNNLIVAYRNRSQGRGGPGFILNTEELASFWHFPADYVRTPQLKRSSIKAVEPPPTLPVERSVRQITQVPSVVLEHTGEFEGQVEDEHEIDKKPTVTLEGEDSPETRTDSKTGQDKQTRSDEIKREKSISAGPPDNLPVG